MEKLHVEELCSFILYFIFNILIPALGTMTQHIVQIRPSGRAMGEQDFKILPWSSFKQHSLNLSSLSVLLMERSVECDNKHEMRYLIYIDRICYPGSQPGRLDAVPKREKIQDDTRLSPLR